MAADHMVLQDGSQSHAITKWPPITCCHKMAADRMLSQGGRRSHVTKWLLITCYYKMAADHMLLQNGCQSYVVTRWLLNTCYVKLQMVKIMEEFLEDYNQVNTAQMKLVLFNDAVRHVCRIGRIVRQPLGNALLLGMGGKMEGISILLCYVMLCYGLCFIFSHRKLLSS